LTLPSPKKGGIFLENLPFKNYLIKDPDTAINLRLDQWNRSLI
jgi:hypothetical protein